MTYLEDLRPGDTCTAWDIIGFDGAFRVAGGRVDWEAADYDDSRGGRLVRLTRLVVDAHGLGQRTRYVHPDTPVTILKACV
jgi:hypothetical protein